MKTLLKKSLGLVVICIGAGHVADAQIDLGKYEIGISGGVLVYRGDLTPAALGSYRTPSPHLNLFVNRDLGSNTAFRLNIARGALRGDDAAYNTPAWRPQRAFAFRSSLTEVSGLIVWNKWGSDRRLSPYLLGGGGLGFVQIARDYSAFNAEYFRGEGVQAGLDYDASRNLPRVLPLLIAGGGVRYHLTSNFSLIAETSFRFTRTDYLDGFSQSANPRLNDHYQSHTIGIAYRFNRRSATACPVVKQ